MKHSDTLKSSVISLLLLAQLVTHVSARTQFASHVSVRTSTRSFTHGVGNPLSALNKRNHNRQHTFKSTPVSTKTRGYPREKPAKPFLDEDLLIQRDNTRIISPWPYNTHMDVAIPLLPASPYKVDSPDPESLWPEHLVLSSLNHPRFISNRRSGEALSEAEDPCLLEGSEATAATKRARLHGVYFQDIPHINSLLANQELRIKNNLKPHRIASIRHTWPYNRP